MRRIIVFFVVAIMLVTTAGCSQNIQKNVKGVPQKWDYEADVVICGFGAAGAMGAKEAILNGESCLVLEKAPEKYAGGSASSSGGYVAPIPAEMLISNSSEYLTKEAADTLAAEYMNSFTWLAKSGMVTDEYYRAEGAGVGFYKILSSAVKAIGANVLYETPAKKLVYDPNTKEVLGVSAEDVKGNTIYVKANKGVLLATGDLTGSKDLVDRLYLPKETNYVHLGSPYNTGDGLVMALEVDAALQGLTSRGIEFYSMALKKASEEMKTALVTGPSGKNSAAKIFVNGNGSRFMNEDLYLVHYKGVTNWLDYPGNAQFGYSGYANIPAYMVFDSKLFNSEGISPSNMDYGWAASKDIYVWSKDNKTELERGWIAKGDTLEELAVNLAKQSGQEPINIEGLQATIKEYNKASMNGAGEKFERTNLQALDSPPYYAAEITTSIQYTMGGLQSGFNGETLGWDGKQIPGLYHAGDVGQINNIAPQGVCGAMATATLAVRSISASKDRNIPGNATNVIKPPTKEQMNLAVEGIVIAISDNKSVNGVTSATTDEGTK